MLTLCETESCYKIQETYHNRTTGDNITKRSSKLDCALYYYDPKDPKQLLDNAMSEFQKDRVAIDIVWSQY